MAMNSQYLPNTAILPFCYFEKTTYYYKLYATIFNMVQCYCTYYVHQLTSNLTKQLTWVLQ